MDFDLHWHLDLRGAAKSLAQNLLFDLQLVLVIRVLVVASPATGEVRAGSLNAVSRARKNRIHLCAREPGLLLGE